MRGVIAKNNPKAIKALGLKIKRVREEKRFSKLQLSKNIGLAHVQLGQYEEGKAAPTYDNLMKIAAALEVPVDFLLSEGGKSNPEYSLDKWVTKAKEVLPDKDHLKIAEYIQLLCIKAESEKMATMYHQG